jgi:hypothetical protein
MDEQERLAYLTKHYNRLQNLRFAAFYVFFVFSPWMDFHRISVSVFLLEIGICMAWFFLMGTYYRRRYGRVKAASLDLNDWDTRHRAAASLLVYGAPSLIACYFLFQGQHAPSDLWLLYLPAAMFAEGLFHPGSRLRRSYYLVAAIATSFTVLSYAIGRMPAHRFFHVYYFTFLGSALLLVGIIDHLLLVRSFRQLTPEVHA